MNATSSSSFGLCRGNEPPMTRISRDISPISTDDEELEPHRELVSVMARWEGPPTQLGLCHESDFLFASFSSYFYKEKDGLSGVTVVKLNISSLQSMEVLSEMPPYKVILHFNHPHPDLMSRILLLEEEDFMLLKELVDPIITHNHQEEEARPPPPLCKECGLPFYGMMAPHAGLSNEMKECCKLCGNKRRHLSPANALRSTKISGAAAPPLKPLPSSDPSSQAKPNMVMGSVPLHERKHSCQKSNAHSSDSSESVSICDSDISIHPLRARTNPEHLSSHSMSSIEVLSERPSTDSDGSLTGSVCTAVACLSSGSSSPLKARLQNAKEVHQPLDTICHSVPTSLREALQVQSEDNADTKGIILEDANKKFSLEIWSKNLPSCYTGYLIEWREEIFEDTMKDLSTQKESTSIAFNFDDLSIVDHRMKLFCEVFLFKEKQELLQGLVKAIVMVDNSKPFPSILVISTRKVYVLQIARPQSNFPQDWLELETVCFLNKVPAICTLFQKQGILLHLQERFVLVCLADAQRTNAVFSFVLRCMERFGFHPRVDDESSRLQAHLLRRLVPLDDDGQEPTVHLFQMVTLLREGGSCTNHFLVLTTSHVILLEADLSWFVSSTSQEMKSSVDVAFLTPDLVTTSCYALDDITQIDVFSDTLIRMEFYHQRPNATRPPWTLHLASPWATCNLIHTLRPLWTNMLKIELALVCFSEDLCIVRELLRDTTYGKYLN